MNKKILSSLMVGTMIAAMAATSVSAEEGYGKLLFLQTHNNNSFMSYMGETFVELAEEAGFDVTHLTADSDEGTQLSQIEQAVASGEYVGVICDCTGEGVTQGFKEAKEAGMFVETLHEGVEDNTYVDVVVACSLAETGHTAINLEVEELGEEFNLAIVNGSEGHGATVAIRKGYDQALEEHPGINVVFDGAGNWNAEDAMALTESWFSSGTQIDGIVCMNDGMATGVRQVMKDNGVLGQIPIYSNDCEIDTLAAIEAGEQRGSFDMNAEAQCKAAIDSMISLIKGEEITEKEIYVDPLLVTIDNLEEYRSTHSGNY
ncbi:MAG: sugar ABC transporter substrate-binding protein [Blautia sp.]|nr:sugar ABC transporter substrate-binding protein [Blautia sp.]MDY5031605.1 sugar ABC transporter substrate-binding protein [Blautia sp.]